MATKVKTPKNPNSSVEKVVEELEKENGERIEGIKNGKVKKKVAVKTGKKGKAVAKVVKKRPAVSGSGKGARGTMVHVTDKYHLQGEYASKAMDKRYRLQEHIASGTATIGSVLADFGMKPNGLIRVARYVRKGMWLVKGVSPTPGAKFDPAAEQLLGDQLAAMKGSTKITVSKMPTELLAR